VQVVVRRKRRRRGMNQLSESQGEGHRGGAPKQAPTTKTKPV